MPRYAARRSLLAALLLGLLVPLFSATPVAAAVVVTDTNTATTFPTIQEAIDAANPGDTLSVSAGTTTENVTVNKSVTIKGATTGATVIDGGGTGTAVTVTAVTVTLQGLTIRNGKGSNGSPGGPGGTGGAGGIANMGDLTLTNATVSGNRGGTGGAGSAGSTGPPLTNGGTGGTGGTGGAGGITNAGTITLTNITLSGNQGGAGGRGGRGGAGGSMANGGTGGDGGSGEAGGITNTGVLTLTNVTLSGNQGGAAGNSGGGGAAGAGGATGAGGAAGAAGPGNLTAGGPTTLTNTIVAGSATNCSTPITDGGHNLEFGNGAPASSCAFSISAQSGDPMLGPLADNGGPTQTMALLLGSAAIDTGDNSAITSPPFPGPPFTDQRGKPRIVNSMVDIGAYESPGISLVVNTNADGIANAANCQTGNASTCRLRDAVAIVNTTAAYGTTITFASDMTITLLSTAMTGTLNLTADMTIDATGHTVAVDGGCMANCGTPSATGGVTVFHVNNLVTANLNALTIQHGNAPAGSCGAAACGGGILNGGTLTVTNSTVAGNLAQVGGGIENNTGTLTVTNSTISGNIAMGDGAGIANTGGAVTVTNSTIAGNIAGSAIAGGILNRGGTVALTNTIVAHSSGDLDTHGNPFTGSNNLIDDTTGAAITSGSNNLINTPALIGTLGSYGGRTQTVPLLPGSPAIDAGDDATCQMTGAGKVASLDQRGFARPQPAGGRCDIGAFEARFSLTINGGASQSAVATQPFALPLAVTFGGPDAPSDKSGAPVTFTALGSGASATFIPNPATTTLSGAASVTANANATAGGPYAVMASTPGAASVTFMLTNTAPTIAVSPGTLPGGVRNIAYTPGTTLTASGGTTPYTFTVTMGTLPPGLTLATNGALTGMPTTVGQYTFTVTATDRNGFMGTQQYTIVVTPAALVSIALTPANATLKVGQQQTFTATATYADNSTADISGAVTWTSDAQTVATVDTTGKITGQTGGTAHLTAKQGRVTSGQATVTVNAPTGTGITVNPSASGRPSGATSGSGTTPGPAPPSGGTTGSGPAPNPAPSGR